MIQGVRVGHWTDPVARTGCTVVLFPADTVASGEIRGGAPATREWEVLALDRLVGRVDACVLTGGSAFGLAACDGVMRFCEERGMGYPTSGGAVPIVVGAALYDLAVGDASVRPGPVAGYAACVAAIGPGVEGGRVGAGVGATVGKWRGPEHAQPGGLGVAVMADGEVVVAALMAVNALGDVVADDGLDRPVAELGSALSPLTNTTIGVVVTNASTDKAGCLGLARAAQDGLARSLWPAHTGFDGDAIVAASVGGVSGPNGLRELLGAMANEATARAVRSISA